MFQPSESDKKVKNLILLRSYRYISQYFENIKKSSDVSEIMPN